ncbi:MAG: hypothetical protein R3Y13_02495 [bacterium]
MKLSNYELNNIVGGGLTISATLFSSLNSLVSTIYEMGQNVGTAIMRITTNNSCSL